LALTTAPEGAGRLRKAPFEQSEKSIKKRAEDDEAKRLSDWRGFRQESLAETAEKTRSSLKQLTIFSFFANFICAFTSLKHFNAVI
jgi:hypothetical protein